MLEINSDLVLDDYDIDDYEELLDTPRRGPLPWFPCFLYPESCIRTVLDVEDFTSTDTIITNLIFLADANQINDSIDNDFNSTINFNLVELYNLEYTETQENLILDNTNNLSDYNNDEYTDVTSLDIFTINSLIQFNQGEDFIDIDDFPVFSTNDLSVKLYLEPLNDSVHIESQNSSNVISSSTFSTDDLSVISDL